MHFNLDILYGAKREHGFSFQLHDAVEWRHPSCIAIPTTIVHFYLPKRCETAGEGSSCRIAIRSAIARAVSSGYELENSVDRKLVLVLCIESFWLTRSIVRSKLPPRHRIGCKMSVSAIPEGTVNNALNLASARCSTKNGTALFRAILLLFIAMVVLFDLLIN